MMDTALARSVLYRVFFFFAAITFGLSCALTGKSISDYNVHSDPVIALIVFSLLSFIVILPLHLYHHRHEIDSPLSSLWVELTVLASFFVAYIGAAGATASGLGVGWYCNVLLVDYFDDEVFKVDGGECGLSKGLTAAGFIAAFILLTLTVIAVISLISEHNTANSNAQVASYHQNYPMNQIPASNTPFMQPDQQPSLLHINNPSNSTTPYSTGPSTPYGNGPQQAYPVQSGYLPGPPAPSTANHQQQSYVSSDNMYQYDNAVGQGQGWGNAVIGRVQQQENAQPKPVEVGGNQNVQA